MLWKLLTIKSNIEDNSHIAFKAFYLVGYFIFFMSRNAHFSHTKLKNQEKARVTYGHMLKTHVKTIQESYDRIHQVPYYLIFHRTQ